MTVEIYLMIFCAIALIIGALMLIIRSAKKFHLTDEQLKNIQKREQEQSLKDDDL